MNTRNTISRIILAALLLVLLPLWSDGTTSLLAERTARELCLSKKSSAGAGEAVLQPAPSGFISAVRRGEDPVPSGHGFAPGTGILPAQPAVCLRTLAAPPAVAWHAETPGFVRMQAKLLFPKHWFW